jgi:hypothetical protein
MWSIDTLYEYGLDVTDLVGTASVYQSTLTQTEVTPNVTPTTPVDATQIQSVDSRLYDLTAFALRQGPITLPASILQGVAIIGTATGPWTGGTQFTINAPHGGLAWVTVGFGENITSTTPASSTRLGTVVNNGASEFSVIVQSPAWTTNENKANYHLYMDDHLLEMTDNKPMALFNYKKDIFLENNLIDQEQEVRQKLENKLKAVIQVYNSRLIDNNLTVNPK